MHFASFSDFLAMGGYGLYVWLAFGVSAAAMLWVVLDNILTRKKIFQDIKKQQARQVRVENAKKLENTL